MKKYLFATAFAVAALASAPAFAQGYIGASASNTEVEVEGFEGDGNAYSIFGAFVAPMNDDFAFQFDGDLTRTDIDDVEDETIVSGTAHLYHETEAYKAGGFAGFSTADDVTIWNAGVEGQTYLDKVNLGGALGYFSVDEADLDGFALQGSATVFPTDNLALGASLGWATAEAEDVDVEVDAWTAGVGAEYQLTSAPVSFFASYSHADLEDFDLTSDTVSVGVTYSFSGTLLERERRGPSLGGLGGVAGLFLF